MGAIAALTVILTILVIVVVVGALAAARYETFLSGLWVGDPGFLRRARLLDMQLYVAPPEGGARQGYLIMVDQAGEFIANGPFEMSAGGGAAGWWSALKSAFRAKRDEYAPRRVTLDFQGSPPPFPAQELSLSLSMLDGTLSLHDGDKVYAFLEKDAVASAAAEEAYAGHAPADS